MPTALARPRSLQPEIMDDPNLDPADHAAALLALARINRLSAADRILFPEIRRAARRAPATLLDVATASADLPIALARRARRAGLSLTIRACDVSPRAIRSARERAARAGAPVDLFQADAIRDPLPEADVVTCSLFLHHLTEDEATHLLTRLARATRRILLVSDLRRCARGSLLARVVPRLITTSRVVHVDAARSADAAFTIPELRTLADRAGLNNASVTPRFPARALLAWKPPA